MCKLVAGEEFDVAKRTIASTKLAEEDQLIFVGPADEMEQVVFQSQNGYFLRILKNGCFYHEEDLCWCKRHEAGRREMLLEHAYLVEPHTGIYHFRITTNHMC